MPSCLACHTDSTDALVTVGEWTYWDCAGCGAAFLDEALLDRQDEVHTGRDYKLNRLLVEARNRHHNQWLTALLKRHATSPGGRVLEVGCGAGFFVKELEREGFTASGIDLGPENTNFAKTYMDIDVQGCDFLTAPIEEGLDWVVMHQLIEHVPQPSKFIARAKDLLRPGGSLLITTPNLRFARKMLKVARLRRGPLKVTGDALGHPPSHCVLFEPSSLKRMLEDQGLETVDVGHNPTGFKDGDSLEPKRVLRRTVDKLLLAAESAGRKSDPVGPNFYSVSRRPLN